MSKVVVGIDFGTSGIGYAYGFSNNLENIALSDFHGQNSDNKVPSEIILDNYLEDILAFGSECKTYIRTHEKEKYEHFKDIKMNLYKKIYTVKSTNGKEIEIEYIISKILKKVSDNALTQIQRVNNQIKKEDIKWIVTIPAIWEEKSKDIMIKASVKAGLIDENKDKSLFLALEPEVAGIYYYISSFSESNFNILHIDQGKPYIICDIGAGTVDICTHRKLNDDINTPELIEEYPPIGGDYGGNKINEEFIKKFIMEIFGEEKVKKMYENEDWDKFEKEIEELKKSCYDNEPTNLNLDCDLFDDESDNKTLDDYISDYDKKNLKNKYKIQKKKKWKLEFSNQIFIDIAKELAEKIFSKIEEIYKQVNTGYILLTGAGSKNYVLTNFFYDFAKEKNMKIQITTAPFQEIAIMKGAVLFGFQNNIIRKRKAKYTFGIKKSSIWKDIYKGKGIKSYEEVEKDYYCSNLFSKFITRNQYVFFDEIITKTFQALNPNPEIIFYKTNKEDCTYIDEKDENGNLILEKLGSATFDIGEDFDVNQRDVIIEMKLGGTYIDICAILSKNGKKLNITKSFD